MLDPVKIRKDFPIFKRKINGYPLIYLDSAATSQRPLSVVKAIEDFYFNHNANVARGVHTLAEEATEMYEKARATVAKFINADSSEIVFVRNATEGLNLIAYGYAMHSLKAGDEVLLSKMEHHSNIVPWQFLQEKGIELKFADLDEEGKLKLPEWEISKSTKIVSITHASNVLGTVNPVKEIAKKAHEKGAIIVVDGAQSVPHMPVDVKDIDCDFLVFSGHKMLGPFGIGVLYGKKELLEKMHPFLGGGDMIRTVDLFETTYNDVPHKFEAGTPNIAGAIGLASAIDYLNKVGMKNVQMHDRELVEYAMKKLSSVKGITIYGPKDSKFRSGVISFNFGNIHPHDLSAILNSRGIAIRSGHACAQPLMKQLKVNSVARISFYIYNTKKDVDALIDAFDYVKKVMRL